MSTDTTVTSSDSRRDFVKKILTTAVSVLGGIVPFFAGVAVFLDPLRRKSADSGLVRVTSLDALPADGIPRKFPVLASRVDAWTKFNNAPIGAVYLRRTSESVVEAFNVVCPHAGCFVDFLPEAGHYHCPCHNSTFTIAGKIDDRRSPSPRGMDSLEVQVRDGKDILVKFQNFQAGRAEKVPVG